MYYNMYYSQVVVSYTHLPWLITDEVGRRYRVRLRLRGESDYRVICMLLYIVLIANNNVICNMNAYVYQ